MEKWKVKSAEGKIDKKKQKKHNMENKKKLTGKTKDEKRKN